MRWVRSKKSFGKLSPVFKRALLITITGNVLLSVGKAVAAHLSNSSAIYADTVNSVSDVLYSIFLVIGLWLAQRPPDKSHPQGHSRFEPIVALIVTISMAFAAYEAGRSAVVRFVAGGQPLVIGLPLMILFLGAGIKILMYMSISRAVRDTISPGLEAAAKDNLSDVATSIAAGVGVLGAQYIHPIFDPIAGFLVALWILRSVIEMVRENLGYLTGAGASQELLDCFVAAVLQVKGVDDVHHVVTEYAGPKLVIDMHINLDGKMTLDEAHVICDRAVAVLENFQEVDRAYVHLEPIGHQ